MARSKIDDTATDNALDGLVQAALEIAQRDAVTRRALKIALLEGDQKRAIKLACQLVGVPELIQFPESKTA
jgi:hypothetical protein